MSTVYESITHPQLIAHLGGSDIGYILGTQLGTAAYLLPPRELPVAPDRTYRSNEELWTAILQERLRATVMLRLEGFHLSEWFPWSPGLFHTQDARMERQQAMSFIVSGPAAAEYRAMDGAARAQHAELGYKKLESPDYMFVFDPYGKSRMIRGGIGSIRLKDKLVGNERLWFMSASSSAAAHEGFPVTLPEGLYARHIEQIAEAGALPCTLVGKLRFLPDTFGRLFEDYVGMPQLYLYVEELEPTGAGGAAAETPFRVSVPISFQSEYEGHPGMYASYVTFYPGEKGSFAGRLDWLENTYVRGMYRGRVVTDFDEQTARFCGATFSLEKVMNGGLQKAEVQALYTTMHIYGNPEILVEKMDQLHIERVEHMTQERVINIGAGASVTAPVVIADRIENSFNSVTNSGLDGEAKELLKQLILQVNEIAKSKAAAPEVTEQMSRDAETLSKEVTSSKPRRKWYEISLEELKQAAINIGEVGKPVLETVGKLLPLLVRLFPG